MIAAGVTRDYGVIACESAMYDTENQKMSYEWSKLIMIGKGAKALTFIGTPLYLSNMDTAMLAGNFDTACMYLGDFLRKEQESVANLMAESIPDEDENKANFCLFFMGMHRGVPTLAQFNSFLNFMPKYLWTKDEPKFATVLYGDDSKPEKAALFKESTKFMEDESKRGEMSAGRMAEILTRGIYQKADAEEKLFGKKYAGGAVSTARVTKEGVLPLSAGYVI